MLSKKDEVDVKAEDSSKDDDVKGKPADASSSDSEIDPSETVQNRKRMIMNIADTRYPVVKHVARKMLKWKTTKDIEDKNFDLFWTDQGVVSEQLSRLNVY